MNKAFGFKRGRIPLLISMPHVGLELTKEIKAGLVDEALTLPDTDWHLETLYQFASGMGASMISAKFSRYVIDLNRPRDNEPLYVGATTGLYPETLFTGEPLFKAGQTPSDAARKGYLEQIWDPYHAKIEEEISRLKELFGYALVFEAHSIRSFVPYLFEGVLPDFNFGTNSGTSCSVEIEREIAKVFADDNSFTHVVNGRFKGGYITRAYGRPAENVHALQLELALNTYMEESPPFRYGNTTTTACQTRIKQILDRMLRWADRHYGQAKAS